MTAESQTEQLTDAPKPPPSPGKKKPRTEAAKASRRVAADSPARVRAWSESKAPPLTGSRSLVGCDLPRDTLDALDAYRDALGHDSRASAARELIADGLARHEARQHPRAPRPWWKRLAGLG